ncbi:MAG: VOC family protein [Sphingomonadaceae bacterium]|nr:VOC family protein [Sphingomonadaceae bacterium]
MAVLGIGGFFFRARDPAALKAWYRHRLGVGGGCGVGPNGQPDEWAWFHEGGPMVFEPFKAETDYFPADLSAMISLRVSGLDALVASLRAAGEEVTREEAIDGVGRFAPVHDPEGNPIELWEPQG